MEKTTVYLSAELKTGLRRVAVRRGVSEAEVIRDAIRRVVAAEQRPRPRAALFESDTLAGRDAERLLDGFGER